MAILMCVPLCRLLYLESSDFGDTTGYQECANMLSMGALTCYFLNFLALPGSECV